MGFGSDENNITFSRQKYFRVLSIFNIDILYPIHTPMVMNSVPGQIGLLFTQSAVLRQFKLEEDRYNDTP
jgi:hypothetical protein